MAFNALQSSTDLIALFNESVYTINEGTTESRVISDNQFITKLEYYLDNAFQNATKSITSFDISPPAGSLHFPLSTSEVRGNSFTFITPEAIGSECARYWSLAIAPGDPVSCQRVVSVINDAPKIAGPIATRIRAMMTAASTGINYEPEYFNLVTIIYEEVSKINWTVVEDTPSSSCNTTLTGNVS